MGPACGRTCKSCSHPNRERLESLLLQGVSARSVAAQFELSAACVHRHRARHMAVALAGAGERRVLVLIRSLVGRLDAINYRLTEIAEDSRRTGNRSAELTALALLSRNLYGLARVAVTSANMEAGCVRGSGIGPRDRGIPSIAAVAIDRPAPLAGEPPEVLRWIADHDRTPTPEERRAILGENDGGHH